MAKKDPQVMEVRQKELTKIWWQQVKDLVGGVEEQYFSLLRCGCPVRADGLAGPVCVLIDLTLQFHAGLCREKERKMFWISRDLEIV